MYFVIVLIIYAKKGWSDDNTGLHRTAALFRPDHAVRKKKYHALVGFRATDINKILENLVFMHLKSAGYEVTVGQIGKQEVDFVCDKAGERLYVQVAYMITDDKVRDREFGNLLAIPDNFPKKVVSMDEVTGGSYRGIDHVHLEDFLLSF
ncbi:MAG: ATP-binding protein [Desulfobacterales bacterium]|nr:ATP-binding protein [Desulfobacterales bacterium]